MGQADRAGVALAPMTLTQKPTGSDAADPGSALYRGTTGGRRPTILVLEMRIERNLAFRRPADSSCTAVDIPPE